MVNTNAFNLQTCARQNIIDLEPYRCARDDYDDDGSLILLDANENPHDPLSTPSKLSSLVNGNESHETPSRDVPVVAGLNRYPDPRQHELKQLFCNLRNTKAHTQNSLTPANLFLGVGSDEAIDALIRAFCVPANDKILVCPPTYSMYSVCAKVNDISVVSVPLQTPSFALDVPAIETVLSSDPSIKILYLCSPGNPTGALLSKTDIDRILHHPTYNGLVVVDEAYIDFAPAHTSLAEYVTEWPNLVVLQTLSKAFGLASIRLGAAFCAPEVAFLLNKLKAPYNISGPTSRLAIHALSPGENAGLAHMTTTKQMLIDQRDRLLREMPRIPGVGDLVGGTDGNFIMFAILDSPRDDGTGNGDSNSDGNGTSGAKPCNITAMRVHERLARDAEYGVVVRFRGKEIGCEGCLRISVGTEAQITRFLEALRSVLASVYSRVASASAPASASASMDTTDANPAREEAKEQAANDVLA